MRARAIAGEGHAHAAIRCGPAAAEIVRLANETDADLIVLGVHAASGTAGGVAIDVESQAPSPSWRCPLVAAENLEDGAEHILFTAC